MRGLELAVLAGSAVAYLWVSSYVTPIRLTPSALLAGLAVVLAGMRFVLRRSPPLSREFRWLLAVSGALLTWAAIVYGITGNYPAGLWQVLQIGLGLGIAFAAYVIVDTPSRGMLFVCVLVFGFLVSAAVAIGQHFVGEPFVSLWRVSGVPGQSIPRVGGAVPGLAPISILLGYQLAVAVPLALSLLLSEWLRGRKLLTGALGVAVGTLALALVLTGSRSALGAGFVGSVFVLLLLRFNKRRRFFLPLLAAAAVGAVLYLAVGFVHDATRFLELEDRSAQVRAPMQLTALKYAWQHPLGTGFYELDEGYLPAELDPPLARMILQHTPHNQFLNVLVYYGFPGLALLILFYGLVAKRVRNLWHALARGSCAEMRWLVAGCAGAILAYLLNSLLHNAGPFVGDVFHWYVLAFLFSRQWAAVDQAEAQAGVALRSADSSACARGNAG